MLFDYRDRNEDREDGIRTFVNYFDESGVNRLFVSTILVFIIFSLAMVYSGISYIPVIAIIFPGIILLAIFPHSKISHSDYLYYFVLDGLMMLSALLMAILPI